MQQLDHRTAAEALEAARTNRRAIAPLTEQYERVTIDDAYQIQSLQSAQRVADGASVKGRKVGLSSRAMQSQLGVDSPDFGVLFDDMFHGEHDPIDVDRFLQPRIEPEIAFVLGRDLSGPSVTVAEALRAIDFLLPALEIIDSRIEDWRISIADTVADNASSGGVVLGSTPTDIRDVDPRLLGCNLFSGGELVATGAGGAVLGSPVLALVWLANTLGGHGVGLAAGDVVLPGSVTRAQVVGAGDTWSAHFAELGPVTACFAGSSS